MKLLWEVSLTICYYNNDVDDKITVSLPETNSHAET
jgi:hypothetical protein